MQAVYVLRAKDETMYVGCTANLKKRLALHNAGNVPATRTKRPWKLVYYEAYSNRADAYKREHYYKTGWGRTYLKRLLRRTLAKN